MYRIQRTIFPALAIASLALVLGSCQKKFDPKSYAPAETFGGYSASNEVGASSLVAHFSFEGALVDSVSKTSATGTGTSYGTGVKGQGLSIGLNNYATFIPTDAIKQLQSMTIAYWVNTPINSAGIQEPVCFVNSTQFWSNLDMFFDGQTDASSVFKMHLYNTAQKDAWLTAWSIANPWGTWMHIALTYDATANKFTFYVNGTQIGTISQAGFGNLGFVNFPLSSSERSSFRPLRA
ncbi:LamG-like jellyroll fold domain-containing protein [Puia sp. P3]|uniref:LamG-like jellyroll fold domain-containing protein n=1 Tax=Puia sp. P3 TaxID=3423952 RepID=UPI003D66BDC3